MKITQAKSLGTIKSAVKAYVDFIAPTYGPAGKKILIASEYGVKAIDDGHDVSKEFEMENEFDNAVISCIKEATAKTNDRVGDGTTTAVILTGAIVEEVIKDIHDPFAKTNYHAEAREIVKASKEAVAYIQDKAKKIKTKEELYKIAKNSYNNEEISKLISDTLFKIGTEGVLLVEDSQGVTTEVEIIKGLDLEKGYTSPYFVNTEKEECILNNPHVLVVNKRIDFFAELVPIIKKIIDSGNKEFIIIAEGFGEDVVNNLIISKIRGIFSGLIIEAPGFGDRTDILQDIATITGASVANSTTLKLEDMTLEDVGMARKVISKKDKTSILDGKGTKEALDSRINKIHDIMDGQTSYNKERSQKRIASLIGGIALIKVGANTENEQKAIKAKVEDAVNATKIAFKDGVVKGGGKLYAEIKTSSVILNKALKKPRLQLEENGSEFLDENTTDPAGVLIAALETATSIACGLITIGGIIAIKRKKEDKNTFDY